MLEQLIESKNNASENKRKGSFLLTTLFILVAVLVSGWTYSLFAKNYGMGNGDLELSSLVAPVAIKDETPPPKPQIEPEKVQPNSSEQPTVIDKFEAIRPTTDPPKSTLGQKDVVPIPNYLNPDDIPIGTKNNIPPNTGNGRNNDGTNDDNFSKSTPRNNKDDVAPEVVVKEKPQASPTPKKPDILRTSTVLNGKAKYLAQPPYPAIAKAGGVSGAVNVQVTIDEEGNVISAKAVSGHPFLRSVAEQAARASKFTPTFLSDQPVKVTGVIVYNFKAQ